MSVPVIATSTDHYMPPPPFCASDRIIIVVLTHIISKTKVVRYLQKKQSTAAFGMRGGWRSVGLRSIFPPSLFGVACLMLTCIMGP